MSKSVGSKFGLLDVFLARLLIKNRVNILVPRGKGLVSGL